MIARYPIELVAGSTSCTVRQQRGPKMGGSSRKKKNKADVPGETGLDHAGLWCV